MSNETNSDAILALVRRIELIALPALIIFGSLCNIMTFIVMRRRRMRISSTCFYMAALAVTDTLVLWTGCLNQWFYIMHLPTLVVKSNLTCKLLPFLFVFFADASVWIIVCMSFERYFAVSRPLSASQICTTRRARWVLILMLGVFALIDGHFLITLELKIIDDEYRVCHPKRWAEYFVGRVFVFIDALKYSAIPFFILLLLSILIIRRVFRAEDISAQLQNLRQLHHYRQYSLSSTVSLPGRSTSIAMHSTTNSNSVHNTRVGRRVTLMLLSVSIAFCVFSAPMSLMQIIQSISKPGHNEIPLAIGKAVAELCQYINHSCNFFLYALTGRIFRREFLRLFFPTRFSGSSGMAAGMAARKSHPGRASFIAQPAHSSSRHGSFCSIEQNPQSLYRTSAHLLKHSSKPYHTQIVKQTNVTYTTKSPLLIENNNNNHSFVVHRHHCKNIDKSPMSSQTSSTSRNSFSVLWRNLIRRRKQRRSTADTPLLFVNLLKPTNMKPISI